MGLRLWQDTAHSGFRLSVATAESDKPGLRGALIVLALDVSQELQVLQKFRASLFGAMAAGSLLAAVLGFLIARRALRPIVRITRSAHRITASQLNERLDVTGVPRELEALAESFNTMLARLEDSFRRLSDFSADLAHEMRTPLTNLLGRTQVAISHSRSADEHRAVLESSVEDIKQLSRWFRTCFLSLAQAGHAETALTRDKVSWRAEAEHLIEFFSMLSEERGIALAVQGDACVYGGRCCFCRLTVDRGRCQIFDMDQTCP